MYRAKIQWQEGSFTVGTTVTVLADDPREAEKAFWRKFRQTFGPVPDAGIVARWKYDPPSPRTLRMTMRKVPPRAYACHAWPAVILAGLTPGASWAALGSAVFFAFFVLGVIITLTHNIRQGACVARGCGPRTQARWRIVAALLALCIGLGLLSWSLPATFHVSADVTIRDDDQPLEHCGLGQ